MGTNTSKKSCNKLSNFANNFENAAFQLKCKSFPLKPLTSSNRLLKSSDAIILRNVDS